MQSAPVVPLHTLSEQQLPTTPRAAWQPNLLLAMQDATQVPYLSLLASRWQKSGLAPPEQHDASDRHCSPAAEHL